MDLRPIADIGWTDGGDATVGLNFGVNLVEERLPAGDQSHPATRSC
jgi:hypothetical protein